MAIDRDIHEAIDKISRCEVSTFLHKNDSYTQFISKIKIERFRHIKDLEVSFDHPVTAISGVNKSGKTSILLLIACSHEKFMRMDATSDKIGMREHSWGDVLSFTSHETSLHDYVYRLFWRVGNLEKNGSGKRNRGSKAWGGLGKKSSKGRNNAKIKNRQVRLIDLDRVLPARAFSDKLYSKSRISSGVDVSDTIVEAFSYIFSRKINSIKEVGNHLNRNCFLIEDDSGNKYSTYNAASGEEAVLYILKDLFDSPENSLILIEEIEVGIHPFVLRRLIDVIYLASWRGKKQIIYTTHSPTALDSVPEKSRKFIEYSYGEYKCLSEIPIQSAMSKMDSIAHPLINLYCEDDIAEFLIKKQLIEIERNYSAISKIFNIIKSGAINEVKIDYERHKRNYPQYRSKIGYAAIFDGDHINHPHFSQYASNDNILTSFIYPYVAPEKFLVRSYLENNPHPMLNYDLENTDHHFLFKKMVSYGLASDEKDALIICYNNFKNCAFYSFHALEIIKYLYKAIDYYSYGEKRKCLLLK